MEAQSNEFSLLVRQVAVRRTSGALAQNGTMVITGDGRHLPVAEHDLKACTTWEAGANAAAHVLAVNNTWNRGINPVAVPDLIQVVQTLQRLVIDGGLYNGVSWFTAEEEALIHSSLAKALGTEDEVAHE